MPPASINPTQLTTGISGLDDLLNGGFHKGRLYLVNGEPGTGKTTLGLQFLLEGVGSGERAMLVSLIESPDELLAVATSHGWSLDGIEIFKIPRQVRSTAAAIQTVFMPGEIEFGDLTNALLEGIRMYRPDRLVIDSVSQLAMLTDSWYQLRGPVLEIKELIQQLGCTSLFTSSGPRESLGELETIVHGCLTLQKKTPAFGQIRRELIVNKMRGGTFVTGYHNFCIRKAGIEIYSWPKPALTIRAHPWQLLSSGINALDDMLGGGLEEGTACLISGTSGTGKSTLASLYLQAAARQKEKSIAFCFDERKDTFLFRCNSLGLEIASQIEQGLINLIQINVGEMSPGEFAQKVRRAVEENDAKVVLIDSLSGYMNAMPEDNLLSTQLHELLNYLGSRDVLTLMVITRHEPGHGLNKEIDASYISDTVITLRHFEASGRIRRCLAVLKKRHGNHEKTIREFQIRKGGCYVGQPLTEFTGILSGNPVYMGSLKKLMQKEAEYKGTDNEE